MRIVSASGKLDLNYDSVNVVVTFSEIHAVDLLKNKYLLGRYFNKERALQAAENMRLSYEAGEKVFRFSSDE